MATWSFCVNTRTKTIRIGWIDLIRAFLLFASHISHDASHDAEHGKNGEPVVVGEPREIEYGQEQNAAVDERQADMSESLSRNLLKLGEDLDKESK